MRNNSMEAVYQSIRDTVQITGLSEYYLRTRIRDGKIKHIRSGSKILINLPVLLAELEQQSAEQANNIVSR